MTCSLIQLVALHAYILKYIIRAELQRIAFDRVKGCFSKEKAGFLARQKSEGQVPLASTKSLYKMTSKKLDSSAEPVEG